MPTDPPDRHAAPADSFAYDVFISYSSKDHVWVRGPLLHQLEMHGLRACIDFRDFQPGAPIVTEMERAVLTSRYTLVVLTPDFVNSSWTEFEDVLTFTLAQGFKHRRVIPLLKAACAPPLRIQALAAVDFTDPQAHKFAFLRLLAAIGPTQAEQPVAVLPYDTVPIPAAVLPGSRPPVNPNQRFFTMSALVDRSVALEHQFEHARFRLSELPLADARAVHAAYTTWIADCLSSLDADLHPHFQEAHLGNEVRPGVEQILTLVIQSRDPDPTVAEPAQIALRPILWQTPVNDLLSRHQDLLETARRRAFPATYAVPQDLKDVIAASQWRYSNGRIDELFTNNGCESHWWLRPLKWYTRKSERRVHGWFTALHVYASDRERAIVQSVCAEVVRDGRLSEAQRAAIQRHVDHLADSRR